MGRSIIVIASGETERRSLPHLLSHLEHEEIILKEVLIPPRHKALNVDMAEKLIKSGWYRSLVCPPDKFVVLVDTDGKLPEEVLEPFRSQLHLRLGPSISAKLAFAFAQWHLEAWFFADSDGLSSYLGRNLGAIDPSNPDEIQNPKLHLTHLLGTRVYTSLISEEIASRISYTKICARSGSFSGLLAAVRNGQP